MTLRRRTRMQPGRRRNAYPTQRRRWQRRHHSPERCVAIACTSLRAAALVGAGSVSGLPSCGQVFMVACASQPCASGAGRRTCTGGSQRLRGQAMARVTRVCRVHERVQKIRHVARPRPPCCLVQLLTVQKHLSQVVLRLLVARHLRAVPHGVVQQQRPRGRSLCVLSSLPAGYLARGTHPCLIRAGSQHDRR